MINEIDESHKNKRKESERIIKSDDKLQIKQHIPY